MPARLQEHLREYRFVGIAEHLGLEQGTVTVPPRVPMSEAVTAAPLGAHDRLPVTVVVPCFNEEMVLPYLSNTLEDVKRNLGGTYDLHFLFVDDGSTDETWSQLERIFGSRPDCSLWQQPRNMGVAAAIMVGIREAKTEVVCSIDCDCTYDPMQLQGMLPLLTEDVALVTASPYHPLGGVMNVPPWRLFLSKGLSRLYRRVLGQRLATFTSCFRVYRRSVMVGLQLEESGFLGVAEMIGLLSMRRAQIAEQPAVLEVRMLGRSKMKIVRTILGHLGLLARFVSLRLKRRWESHRSPVSATVEDPHAVATIDAKQGRR
jgi:glycosyltransferase involved in cell wall biosynthesis